MSVVDEYQLSRGVLDRTWPNLNTKSAENDPNLALQDGPKSIKNRCAKIVEILIDFKTAAGCFLGPPGGMRWPPGGIIGGSKNYPAGLWFCILKICRCLRHIMALRFEDLKSIDWAFGFLSDTRCSTPTGRAAD